MKVVINRCYGGFGISNEALIELFKRNAKCLNSYTPIEYYGGYTRPDWEEDWKRDFETEYTEVEPGIFIHNHGFNIYKDGLLYSINAYDYHNVRTDKDLINIVEKLGKKSFNRFSDLEIVEIPDGIEWEINEYDGVETIHECHRSWP